LTICFPESDGAANHTSGNKNNQQFPPLTSKIPRFKPLWRWYNIASFHNSREHSLAERASVWIHPTRPDADYSERDAQGTM
jgi:hypothetical protein